MNERSEPRPRRWRGLILTTLGLILPFQGGCACGCAAAGSPRPGGWGCAPGAAARSADEGRSGAHPDPAPGAAPPVTGVDR